MWITITEGRRNGMGAWKSLRSLLRRIRQEGIGCVPGAVYTRGMTLIHRGELRREQAVRAADEAAYQAFIARHTQPDSSPFETTLTLSFLIPVYNTEPGLLRQLADSLLAQSCPRWEACLFDGASTRADTRTLLEHLAQEDCRFRVRRGEENLGISGNTNAAYAMARGDGMALCDHDDLLAPDAVRCLLQAAQDAAGRKLTLKEVFAGASKGNIDLQEIVQQYEEMLGTGIVNIVNMFRPQLILLGGAMSEYAQTMTGPILEMMKRDCFGGEHGMIPEIAAAELGSSAGMIGAANL
jgi:hypothetical protein